MAKKTRIFVADFETANNKRNIVQNYTFVWLWDICDLKDFSHKSGRTVENFLKEFEKIGSCIVWMHNLKFDGSFLIDWLLKNGYEFCEEKELEKGQFSALVSGAGEFFSIRVCLNCKNKKKIIIDFWDSLKKIRMSVDKIAQSFDLGMTKGVIDYESFRDWNYIATEQETKYCQNDTEIVARALSFLYLEGLDKMTISADALALYKKWAGKHFYTLFPVLNIEVDDEIRKAYTGGICYLSEDFKSIEVEDVRVYDVNSMYASVMSEEVLPFGEPLKFEGKFCDKKRKLFVQHVWARFKLKTGKMPTILNKSLCSDIKKSFIRTTGDEMLELWLTNVDLELLFENYEVFDIKYVDGYSFFGSRNMFKKYIDPIYKRKCKSVGAIKQICKSLLVELYGKFATNPHRTNKIPTLKHDAIVFEVAPEVKEISPVYTPVACFITAYARRKLIKAIEENANDFVYCDTDSVHLKCNAKGIKVDDELLGAWKLERRYKRALYIGQKAYIGEVGQEIEIKLAGAPEVIKKQISFDNFKRGARFPGKLQPTYVRGGVVLRQTYFTIRAR